MPNSKFLTAIGKWRSRRFPCPPAGKFFPRNQNLARQLL
jgi:hypothetical protein